MAAQEFGGDLAGSEFWGADLKGSVFRDVDLTGTKITHARVVDIEIDAMVDRLVVNGVDVTSYVNEHDPWYPLRSMLEPPDPAGMRTTWAALEAEWAKTIDDAHGRPEEVLHESVGGEWSFVQTVRHLVFAIDKWFTAPVLDGAFDPMGVSNSGSVDFPWPGLDAGRQPTAAEALTTHAGRCEAVRQYLEGVEAAELERTVDVLENGPHPVRACLFTVFEETFWHNRYARRDLAQLAP